MKITDLVSGSNTYKYTTGCGNVYVTICSRESGSISKILVNIGKAGGCQTCTVGGLVEMLNYALSLGGDIEEIRRMLRDQNCHNPGTDCGSCVDAIGRALERHIKKMGGLNCD